MTKLHRHEHVKGLIYVSLYASLAAFTARFINT